MVADPLPRPEQTRLGSQIGRNNSFIFDGAAVEAAEGEAGEIGASEVQVAELEVGETEAAKALGHALVHVSLVLHVFWNRGRPVL